MLKKTGGKYIHVFKEYKNLSINLRTNKEFLLIQSIYYKLFQIDSNHLSEEINSGINCFSNHFQVTKLGI